MDSLSIASTGKLMKILPFRITFKSWKYLILLTSYSFLGYKLFTFNHYEDLSNQWIQMPLSRLWWLAGVFTLLPLNWYLESLKWKVLISHVQKINTGTSVKAVLSGISTGFFTPNRVGELVGRIAFLEPENRKAGITMSLVNSLTQNIVMAMCGIPACILYFINSVGNVQPDIIHFVWIILIGILILGSLYFTLPHWSRQLKTGKLTLRIRTFTDCLSGYTRKELLKIIGVSLIRYVVFCTQFYFMLRFFNIELTPFQALMAIPTTYLFVTFTPSLAFSEVAVRSSYAVLIIGAFSCLVVNIALAGVCIWAVNFVIPMLVGSALMIRKSV